MIYSLDLWILFAFVFALLFMAAQLGFQIANALMKRKPLLKDTSEFVPTTILGLLALIIGFTFSMSINRYEMRKDLVVKEANAIDTTRLRSLLLEEDSGKIIRQLLINYVDARLAFFEAGDQQDKIEQAELRTLQIQKKLWDESIKVTKHDRGPIAALFISSLNETIDLRSERYNALQNRVPEFVYFVILFIAFIGLLNVGMSLAYSRSLHRWSPVVLALLLSSVICLIRDLDSPRTGLIKVSQRALLLLKDGDR